jgi:hypothetical protein
VVVKSLWDALNALWLIIVAAMIGLGFIFAVVLLARGIVEGAFRVVGHPLGDNWAKFCSRTEELANKLMRPLVYAACLVLVLMILVVAIKTPFGCGWAGVLCE